MNLITSSIITKTAIKHNINPYPMPGFTPHITKPVPNRKNPNNIGSFSFNLLEFICVPHHNHYPSISYKKKGTVIKLSPFNIFMQNLNSINYLEAGEPITLRSATEITP